MTAVGACGAIEGTVTSRVKDVLAMAQSGKAGSSDALENHDKPGIRRPAVWLLGGQVDQLGWADSLMQQCGAARTNDDKRGQIC